MTHNQERRERFEKEFCFAGALKSSLLVHDDGVKAILSFIEQEVELAVFEEFSKLIEFTLKRSRESADRLIQTVKEATGIDISLKLSPSDKQEGR